MSPNLPPVLPSGSHAPNTGLPLGGIQRAQNLSVSKLQQHTERENATVSINQALSRSPGMKSGYTKSTSIHHAGTESATVSAAGHQHAKRSIFDTEYYDEDAEQKRYEYVRRLILQRKAKQKQEQVDGDADGKGGRYKMYVGTGVSLTSGGASGLHKRVGKFFKKYRGTYKNISSQDKVFFENLVTGYAKKKVTGSPFGYSEKRHMRWDVEKARRQGTISYEDARDFKKLIDNLGK